MACPPENADKGVLSCARQMVQKHPEHERALMDTQVIIFS